MSLNKKGSYRGIDKPMAKIEKQPRVCIRENTCKSGPQVSEYLYNTHRHEIYNILWTIWIFMVIILPECFV